MTFNLLHTLVPLEGERPGTSVRLCSPTRGDHDPSQTVAVGTAEITRGTEGPAVRLLSLGTLLATQKPARLREAVATKNNPPVFKYSQRQVRPRAFTIPRSASNRSPRDPGRPQPPPAPSAGSQALSLHPSVFSGLLFQ